MLEKVRVAFFPPTVLPASSSSSPTSSAADRASPPRPMNRGRLGGRCRARNPGRSRSHRSRRTWTGGRRSLNWRNTFDFPAKRGEKRLFSVPFLPSVLDLRHPSSSSPLGQSLICQKKNTNQWTTRVSHKK